jgi:hypothetical protein
VLDFRDVLLDGGPTILMPAGARAAHTLEQMIGARRILNKWQVPN